MDESEEIEKLMWFRLSDVSGVQRQRTTNQITLYLNSGNRLYVTHEYPEESLELMNLIVDSLEEGREDVGITISKRFDPEPTQVNTQNKSWGCWFKGE